MNSSSSRYFKRYMKRKNIVAIAVIAAVIAVAVLAAIMLTRGDKVVLQGETDVTVYKASSKVAGRIEKMYVREGQTVKKGDLLYVLSTPELDARRRQAVAAKDAASAQESKANRGARTQEVDAASEMCRKAQAGLDLAEKSYARVKKLYEEGVVPAQKLDEAEANYLAARATLSAAQAQYDMAKEGARREDRLAAQALTAQAAGAVMEVEAYIDDACVYSPADGEVSTIIAREGELVGSGFPVVTILDMSDIWVAYNIKETLLPRIAMGTRFSAYVPALDRDIELVVDYIAPQGDFATWSATRTQGGFDVRTFHVKARPASGAEGLRPGMSAVTDWKTIQKQ